MATLRLFRRCVLTGFSVIAKPLNGEKVYPLNLKKKNVLDILLYIILFTHLHSYRIRPLWFKQPTNDWPAKIMCFIGLQVTGHWQVVLRHGRETSLCEMCWCRWGGLNTTLYNNIFISFLHNDVYQLCFRTFIVIWFYRILPIFVCCTIYW